MLNIRRPYLLFSVALVIATIYYSSIFAESCSVDDAKMLDYLLNTDSFSLKGIFLPGGSGYYYRPLLFLTFVIDKYLWGLHESFMHLENVLLHLLNSILVFFITARVAAYHGVKGDGVPFTAAIIFALHPLNTEPVNWISGRTDVLAASFIFLALLMLLKALEELSPAAVAVMAVSFFAATLAKDSAIFWFPAAVVLLSCYPYRASSITGKERFFRFKLCTLLSLTVVAAMYFTLRHFAYKANDGGVHLAVKGVVAGELHLYDKIRIVLKVFGYYLKKVFFPLPLNFATMNVSDWYVVAGIAGVLFVIFLLYKRNILTSLLLMSVAILSPAMLVPLGRMAWTPIAERYLYMPLGIALIVIVVVAAQVAGRLRMRPSVPVVVLLLCIPAAGYATYQRNLVWQTNLSLFQDCVRKSPDAAPVKNELALALQRTGHYDEAKKIYLANVVPAREKYSIVSDINRATSLASNGDIRGGINILELRGYDSSKPMYDEYLKNMVYLKSLLANSTENQKEKLKLQKECVDLTIKLQEYMGDPYLYYTIGKLYLGIRDKKNAAKYFQLAADRSPESAFYKEPARKLATRLRL